MTLQEEYTKEKHAVPQFEGYFSQDYTLWLENKIEQQRISDTPVLSAVPSFKDWFMSKQQANLSDECLQYKDFTNGQIIEWVNDYLKVRGIAA